MASRVIMYNALEEYLRGKIAYHSANVEVYLSNPVAIGEHSDIGEEVEKKVSNIDQLNSKIETIRELLKTLNK